LFDIAHVDALERMKIEEDKLFLMKQREPGQLGCLCGVGKNWQKKRKDLDNDK